MRPWALPLGAPCENSAAAAARLSDYTRSDPKDICVVTETYPPEVNGVALTLRHLVEGLTSRGHRVSLVRPRQAGGFSPSAQPKTIEVKGLPLPGYKGLQLGLPASARLLHCWTQTAPDVVYVATEGPLGWSAVRTARRLGIPIVSGFHTNFDRYAKHYGLGCLQRLVFGYLRRFHNRTAATLTATADLREALLRHGFRNLTVVSRGVDSDLFSPERRSRKLRRQWGLGDDDLAVVYVGRVAPEKNLELAVAAYRKMTQSCRSLRFVIVGDGPSRSNLERKHADLIFCGTQTGEALAQHFASADMFLFPSESETFGNVTLEAMASGLAVVAYDYAAARIHIVDRQTGLLAPYRDQSAFIDAASSLARTPQLLNLVRNGAREYVAKVGWQRVIDDFEAALAVAQTRTPQPAARFRARRGLAAT
ncbi:MAG TPA: glycosyltransferase family 1 protein [Candidatus Binataceae bacterium]|nr:glycosyltransferase family 1 protein [Candidatus Binataceae bacterium]